MDTYTEPLANDDATGDSTAPGGDVYEFPVTFAQQRMWFLNRLQPDSTFYNSPWSLRITGPLSVAGLERSIGEILRRHEVLRTTLGTRDGEPVQVVSATKNFELPVRDLSVSPDPPALAAEVARQESRRSMDLERGPLFRAELLRLAEDDHVLLVLIHHIVFDGWSRRILATELWALYEAFSTNRPSPLPDLSLQYGDFAVWQQRMLTGEKIQKQLDYWKKELDGAPATIELPADHARPALATFRGARTTRFLPRPLLDRLRELSGAEGVTLFMTLVAAFNVLLFRYTGQDDIVIGTPIAGRNRIEIEKMIGLFVNSLALRTILAGNLTFRQLLASVRETTLRAFANQDLPFERLVEELRAERDLSRNPVFQVMLALQNVPGEPKKIPGLTTSLFIEEGQTSKFDLMVFCVERENGLQTTFEYSTDLFEESTIGRMMDHFRILLEEAVRDSSRQIGQMPILMPAERRTLLVDFNDTARDYPKETSLPVWIEQQVESTPDAVALISDCPNRDASQLTYRELNARANRIAGLLRNYGAGSEILVAICLDRTPDMVAGVLGILKSGGAYLPLDPEYPRERLAYILDDSKARLLLTTVDLREMFPAFTGKTICLDGDAEAIDAQSGDNPGSVAGPETLAYVLYTSGSTGKPKGVQITHRNVINFLATMQERPGIQPADTLLAVTTLSFDIAGLEIYLPLVTGARIVLATRDQARDADSLIRLIERWGVTILQATPVTWRTLIETGWTGNGHLKALCGGEALPGDLAGNLVPLCGELWNMYGPTETTIWSSVYRVRNTLNGIAPIGSPVGNTTMYVLDSIGQPQPVGVPGELYIGGDGVGRGYLDRPELTREKFLADPFGTEGARMYRTGDLARFLPDGDIQYLGRTDFQVKLRGFRIELGEIEAVLDRHPAVQQSVVLIREDEPGLPRLVAYVVPSAERIAHPGGDSETEQVSEWSMAWDESYREGLNAADPTFNIAGWNSSYTHEPIPPAEMRTWVDNTVERILGLQPKRVWEIGCGTGLLLFRIAGQTEHYHGTDVSRTALQFLRGHISEPRRNLRNVTLEQRAAHQFDSQPAEFDLVILNSVIQYFPDIGYLIEVLNGAIRSVGARGAVFIGDVRSRALLKNFHTSVKWFQVADTTTPAVLLQQIEQAMRQEEELVIDPELFLALRQKIPQISRVEIQLKKGRERNELTRFRYDVILHVGDIAEAPLVPPQLDWSRLKLTPDSLRQILTKTQPEILVLTRVPDARLESDVAALHILDRQDDSVSNAAGLRSVLAREFQPRGVEPEDLWKIGVEMDYSVELRSSHAGADGLLDVMLCRKRPESGLTSRAVPRFPGETDAVRRWESYANNPMRQKLMTAMVPELRDWACGQLPEYMAPSAYVLLDSIPLAPNGKVNRRALPQPEMSHQTAGDYVAPRTETEKRIAEIWSAVLHLSRVGTQDNFFGLGGHSLLATQMVSRIRQAFEIDLPLRAVFENPTVEKLAKQCDALRQGEAGEELSRIVASPRDRPIPLSFTQQRLWFLDRMDPLNPAYNMPWTVRLQGPLDTDVLERSLNELLRRHEALRTRFEQGDGDPVQTIDPWRQTLLRIIDLSNIAPASREDEARRLAKEEASRPFDLATGPLLRGTVIRIGPEDHVLILNTHHIVSDAWSLQIMRREIFAAYDAFGANMPSPFEDLPVQYADYSVWQRDVLAGERLGTQLAYWKKQLEGAPAEIELPLDHPRPVSDTTRGAKKTLFIAPNVLDGLLDLSRQEGVTLFMTLLSAFTVLLSRYSGQDDIVVGSLIAGRHRLETEKLIGFFVNTLALRLNLSGDPTFGELLARVRETTLAAYAHQDVPFEKLVEEVQPERSLNRQPLFQVMFALQNVPGTGGGFSGVTLSSFPVANDHSKFDLTLIASETTAGLRLNFEYKTDLFEETTIARMLGHMEVLLRAIVGKSPGPVSRLPILTAQEEKQLLVDWNDTQRDYPQLCIHEIFVQQAAKTPNAVAVIFREQSVTYAELNERSDKLANHLRTLGVGTESRVGICLERTPEMIVGLLGILKAGGAYVPLEPNYPSERLQFLIRNAELQVVLTVSSLAAQLPSDPSNVVLLDGDDWPAGPTDVPKSQTLPDSLAYVVYTSGSTGEPKGVETPHRAVIRLLFGVDYARFTDKEVILQAATLSFDASTFEIWGALLHGGKIVIFPERVPTVSLLRQIFSEHQVTTLFLTTSLFNWLIDEAPDVLSGARQLLTGGEANSVRHFRRALELLPELALKHVYGPTETTTFATSYEVPRVLPPEVLSLPIGRPIANTTAYVLDRRGELVPVGVPGELFIGGDGLARGYLNQPEVTAQKFVRQRFPGGREERVYATGDLVRLNASGEIEFLGRRDTQVKIRGFRIEPGEIEAMLGRHPDVRDCAVIVREDTPGDKRIVAYVLGSGDRKLPPSELRTWLKARLPEFLVPAAIVQLDAFPLSASGKVNRKILPAPEYGGSEAESYAPPTTPVAATLAGIWEDLLRKTRVGLADNFFLMGGHSLLATQLVSRIHKILDVEIPLRAIFEEPTLVALASRIENLQRDRLGLQLPPLVPASRNRPIPLSFVQQRLWFLDRMDPLQANYNIPLTVRLRGPLNIPVLGRCLNEIVRRHEALRTRFGVEGGEPVQVVGSDCQLKLELSDLSGLPVAEILERARELTKQETSLPFDLKDGPVLRARIVRLGEDDHVLVLTIHHIVSDGWSMALMRRELTAIYNAFLDGSPSPLEDLPIQYPDYTLWQRETLSEERLQKQIAFWKKSLAGAPMVLELPTDRPRPVVETFRGANCHTLIPKDLLDDLRVFSHKEGATLFMTLLSAFGVLLSRYSGQRDIVIGTPIAGRNRFELENLIGFFVNTLVLRVNQTGDPTFAELLGQVRETTMDAYAHQDLPFERLVEELQPERDLSRNPVFQVVMVLQNMAGSAGSLRDIRSEAFSAGHAVSKFDLTLVAAENASGLHLNFEYNTDLFEQATIARMLGHMEVLLRAIAGKSSGPVSRLPILTAPEEKQLLVDWNDTQRDYPQLCIHEVFRQQAAKTPDAVAVIFREQSVTYAELNERSDRLANHLRTLGVGTESRVGICVERTPEMIVGLLGILKAGGAYVPLESNYPPERLQFLIRNAELQVVLTVRSLAAQLPSEACSLVLLEGDWSQGTTDYPKNPPGPDSLAYVLYTSGSTGEPKGVETPHRAVLRLVFGVDYARFTADEVILQAATLSFDASTFEIWGALLHGAKLVIFPERVPTASTLKHVIAAHQVTTLWLTASLFNWIVDEDPTVLSSAGQILTGGEALSVPHIRKALASLPDATLINGYGPTETTTFAACYRIPRSLGDDIASIPIGWPISNTTAYVLDENLQLVPIGVPGELYVGGPGLARGYLGQPELTARKFITNSFTPDTAVRLYATGDLVRRLPGGELEFLGRRDTQVKIRGFRIEPGEIEAILGKHPDVRECAVTIREDTPGDKRIVGYVLAVDDRTLLVSELRAWLKERLPDFLVPAAVVQLSSFPLTPNGKVDRKALPAPEYGAPSDGFMAPRTELEQTLATIWSEMLSVPQVGINDNFFALGGHSLLAVRVFARMEEVLQQKVPLHILFRSPTIAEIAIQLHRNDNVIANTSLRPCRTEGSKLPLYAVPGIGGTVLTFRYLAPRLDPDRPIYCLEGIGLDGSWSSLEELAALYVRDIRNFQPEGPYHLIGSSFGGMAIFEMAQQLHAQGQKVALLGFLDSVNMGQRYLQSTAQVGRERVGFYIRRVRLHTRRMLDRSVLDWPRYSLGRVAAVGRRIKGSLWRVLYRSMKSPRKILPAPMQNVKRAYEAAGMEYVPRPYPGNAVLFRTAQQSASGVYDEYRGWQGLVLGEMKVVIVPGDHNSLISEPHVEVLAREIEDYLTSCSREDSETGEATLQEPAKH